MTESSEQIHSLFDLVSAADRRRAVYIKEYGFLKRPKPAAWVLQLSGAIIYRLLRNGLYLYPNKGRQRKHA